MVAHIWHVQAPGIRGLRWRHTHAEHKLEKRREGFAEPCWRRKDIAGINWLVSVARTGEACQAFRILPAESKQAERILWFHHKLWRRFLQVRDQGGAAGDKRDRQGDR